MNSMPSILLSLKPDCSIDFVNPTIEEVTGYSPGELQGKDIFSTLFSPIRGTRDLLKLEMSSHDMQHVEFHLKTKINGQRVFSCCSTPMRSDSGAVERIIASAIDVTEKKKREGQMLQAQKMESIGLLAGGIAHDFNNLLSGIMGHASLLEKTLPTRTQEHRDVQVILRATERATDLASRLLSFVRGGKVQSTVLNLNEVIEEARAILSRTINRSIKIETHLAKDLFRIRADGSQVEQILLNLLINARDAMPEGGTITIESQNAPIDETFVHKYPYFKPGKYALVTIRDTGTGMDEEVRRRVFEPFFTTKKSNDGTGLGLAMVYGIVKNYDGYIHVESEQGQGTTFKVYLPSHNGKLASADDTYVKENAKGGKECILIADDEEVVRMFIAGVLENAGYRAMTASDSEKTLKVFKTKRKKIKLIILDMIMPEISGNELFEQLRTIDPDVKILVVSGYPDSAYDKELFEKNARFLKKPFMCETLLSSVRDLLDS